MRTYFYKADEFPEVRVNERHELKSLANSCHIEIPQDDADEEEEEKNGRRRKKANL